MVRADSFSSDSFSFSKCQVLQMNRMITVCFTCDLNNKVSLAESLREAELRAAAAFAPAVCTRCFPEISSCQLEIMQHLTCHSKQKVPGRMFYIKPPKRDIHPNVPLAVIFVTVPSM